MDGVNKIEQALDEALSRAEASGAPPRLASALRYAVFPGGARIRPRLCLAVAHACGIEDAAPATAAKGSAATRSQNQAASRTTTGSQGAT